MAYRFGYVPPPLPDETVYSFLAAQQRLLPDRHLTRKLFGGWCKLRARPDWPIGLDALAAALPPSLQLDADSLVLEHTVAPLFLPLLQEQRQKQLIRACISVDAGHPWRLAGSPIHGLRELLACPVCFEENQRQARAYWHRIHQCQGVLFCPLHPDVCLGQTEITRDRIHLEKRFFDLDQLPPPIPKPWLLSKEEQKRASRISLALAALLSNPCLTTNVGKIRLALREKALGMGYTSAPGRVHGSKLVADLNKWLGLPLSHALGLNENGIVHCHWAYQFLARERASVSPLKYTLLAVFLGAEPNELAHSSSSLTVPPIGDCGRNSGGVHASLLRLKRARSKLRRLWKNPSISVGEITRRLEISHITACKWALRLNLDFPRKGPSPAPAPRMTQAQFVERRNRKRSEWLVSASGLRGGAVHNPKTGELYRWLGNYDADWLRKHWPKYRKIEKIDWKTRDRLLVEKLKNAARFLLGKKRPCWVSKTRLAHEIRYAGFRYRGHRSKLPKAYKLLIKLSEPRAAFTARRLRHQ